MDTPVMVRAIFGDEQVDTWPKSKGDVADCKARGHILPGSFVVAFGQPNSDVLTALGIEHRVVPCAPGEGVHDFLKLGTRNVSGWRNNNNYGIIIWRHKLEAVRLALEEHEAAIWCDWDTKIMRTPDQTLYDSLAAGPEFQGRYRQYRRSISAWRKHSGLDHARKAFHGACFYMRGKDVIQRAIRLMEDEHRDWIDEPLFTLMVDRMYFDGRTPEPDDYMKIGVENHLLHTTHNDVIKQTDKVKPYFAEGRVVRKRGFQWRAEVEQKKQQEAQDGPGNH